MVHFNKAMVNLRETLSSDGNSESQIDTKITNLNKDIGDCVKHAVTGNFEPMIKCVNNSNVLTSSQKQSFIDDLNA